MYKRNRKKKGVYPIIVYQYIFFMNVLRLIKVTIHLVNIEIWFFLLDEKLNKTDIIQEEVLDEVRFIETEYSKNPQQ